ncbi:uncharacterized protein ACBT57_007075 isoform 3-T4 [Dama dama]
MRRKQEADLKNKAKPRSRSVEMKFQGCPEITSRTQTQIYGPHIRCPTHCGEQALATVDSLPAELPGKARRNNTPVLKKKKSMAVWKQILLNSTWALEKLSE